MKYLWWTNNINEVDTTKVLTKDGITIAEYLLDFVENKLPKNTQGNMDPAIFTRFIENIPENFIYTNSKGESESFKNRLLTSRIMDFFKNLKAT